MDLVLAAVSTSILTAGRTTTLVDMHTTASATSHHIAEREQTALIATSIVVISLLTGIADSLASTRQLLSVQQNDYNIEKRTKLTTASTASKLQA
jgi:hypothetical protein